MEKTGDQKTDRTPCQIYEISKTQDHGLEVDSEYRRILGKF